MRVESQVFKRWKLWAKNRRVETGARNENFVFYANKWIKYSFPDSIVGQCELYDSVRRENCSECSDLYPMGTKQTTSTFSTIIIKLFIAISNAIQTITTQHYCNIRYETSITFAHATMRKILMALIKRPRHC